MKKIKWIYSNEEKQWQHKTGKIVNDKKSSLWFDGNRYQKMFGFGACLNELGYKAIQNLNYENQDKLMKELFMLSENGSNLNFCRIPIGANDYSENWYSLNETDGDYKMENFSIERDKKILIPYIKKLLDYNKNLKIFASPWSPPTWMKNPPVYNGGKLIFDKENLQAYALYLALFIENYKNEGIHIDQLHVQNEPVANQK